MAASPGLESQVQVACAVAAHDAEWRRPFGMGSSFELEIPFDVLDAAVHECLPGYSYWGTFTRVPVTSASTKYMLTDSGGKPLGDVTIRKIASGRSNLAVHDPPKSTTRPFSAEEQGEVQRAVDRAARAAKLAEIRGRIRAEEKEEYGQRRRTQEYVIRALFSRLYGEGLLQGQPGGTDSANSQREAADEEAAGLGRQRRSVVLEDTDIDWLAEWLERDYLPTVEREHFRPYVGDVRWLPTDDHWWLASKEHARDGALSAYELQLYASLPVGSDANTRPAVGPTVDVIVRGTKWGPTADLRLRRLGRERVEVTAVSRVEPPQPHFQALLAEMASRWAGLAAWVANANLGDGQNGGSQASSADTAETLAARLKTSGETTPHFAGGASDGADMLLPAAPIPVASGRTTETLTPIKQPLTEELGGIWGELQRDLLLVANGAELYAWASMQLREEARRWPTVYVRHNALENPATEFAAWPIVELVGHGTRQTVTRVNPHMPFSAPKARQTSDGRILLEAKRFGDPGETHLGGEHLGWSPPHAVIELELSKAGTKLGVRVRCLHPELYPLFLTLTERSVAFFDGQVLDGASASSTRPAVPSRRVPVCSVAGWVVAGGCMVLVVALARQLARLDPRLMPRLMQQVEAALQHIWRSLQASGQVWETIQNNLLLVAFVLVVLTGIWQRRRARGIVRRIGRLIGIVPD